MYLCKDNIRSMVTLTEKIRLSLGFLGKENF